MDPISMVTTPLSLISLFLFLGVRAASVAILWWFQLMNVAFRVPMDLCWRAMVWTLAFVTLPLQALGAIQREKALEMRMNEMLVQIKKLVWENNELEERLQIAIKDQKVIETICEEIEEEHERTLSRMNLLERELQDLREENLRLNNIQGKALWDYKANDAKGAYVPEGIPVSANYGVPSWGSDYKGGALALEDILMHDDPWVKGGKGKPQEQYVPKPTGSSPASPKEVIEDSVIEETLDRQREVAVKRSFFSAILSFMVGMIIWKAEDPCMPLVTALFIVVGMSLNSVVQFFSTIKNKPASDAVALLSINWFILGTITSPSLPSIARKSVPVVIKLADRLASWLGKSDYVGYISG